MSSQIAAAAWACELLCGETPFAPPGIRSVALLQPMHPSNDQLSRSPVYPSAAVEVRPCSSLTYEPFYGLREKPFSLSADPRFLFRSPGHGSAFDDLLMGIRRREGLVVLTGEIGTGKTTLCRSVLQHLDRRTFASFVADPFVSREDLLKTLLVDFGVISIGDLTRGRFEGASRSDLSYPLYEFLDSLVPLQAFAVVVIDEAQNLSLPLLEEIRILSELERREKLLQVVLVGQPELRSNLKLPQMRQVDQRVSVRCELTALNADGIAGYVNHRLTVAAAGERRIEFTLAAIDAIYEGSSGVPRLINRICDRALQHAYAARSVRIDSSLVWKAVDDLGLATSPRTSAPHLDGPPLTPRDAIAEFPAEETPHGVGDAVTSEAAPVDTAALASATAPLSAAPRLPTGAPDTAAANGDSRAGAILVHRGLSRWLPVAAAAACLVAISASLAFPGMRVDDRGIAALLPPRPAPVFLPAAMVTPNADAASAAPMPDAAAVPAATSLDTAAAGGASAIVVASFESSERAARLVEELTSAGYRARAVERDGGPSLRRLVQVNVGGYTSLLDAERDLQQIRELPGGYRDARIVTRP